MGQREEKPKRSTARRGALEPPKRKSILLTELDYRDQALCSHHYERSAVFNAVFTMRSGQTHERKLCWDCVKRIYQNLDLIESFMPKPITSELLATAEPDDGDDIAF